MSHEVGGELLTYFPTFVGKGINLCKSTDMVLHFWRNQTPTIEGKLKLTTEQNFSIFHENLSTHLDAGTQYYSWYEWICTRRLHIPSVLHGNKHQRIGEDTCKHAPLVSVNFRLLLH